MKRGETLENVRDIAQDGSGTTQFSTLSAEGLAYSSQNDLVYAIINGTFRSVSPTTGAEVAALTGPGVDLEGLAADDGRGLIYGIGRVDSLLYVYDIAADTWSTVGDTGVTWNASGLAFNAGNEMLYAIGHNGDASGLYRIDPSNASISLVGDTGLTTAGGGLAWVPAN